jgi:hypothetical protein
MERLRVRIETPQTPRIRLNVRPVLTEEDKEVKHIIEESEGRLQAERTRRREQPQGAGPHGRGKTGKIQKRQGRYRVVRCWPILLKKSDGGSRWIELTC